MNSSFPLDEDGARGLDAGDPLARFRERFHIPAGTIYLDGNSLGLASREAEAALARAAAEWRDLAIGGWTTARPPWLERGEALGAAAAELVGAAPGDVVCTGTTTVNLHALVCAFYQPAAGRAKILADSLNFPSDLYALRGQIQSRGGDPARDLVLAGSRDGRTLDEEELIRLMSPDVALVLLPSVLYRSGQLLDVARLAAAARERGIPAGFDCSHSAGAVPHRFDDWGVDFAFWCSYKYLNGGPGSPAFLYVSRRHAGVRPLLAGWWGCDRARQFDMDPEFQPAAGAAGFQISTPGILSAAPLEGALALVREAGIARIREKSLRLTSFLMHLVDHLLPGDRYRVRIGSPREPARRGGHVALELGDDAWPVYQALKGRGVVPDFRPPDVIRVAPVALYNTFHEVWRTVQILQEILDNWEHQARSDLREDPRGGIRL
jgi:kynureninase